MNATRATLPQEANPIVSLDRAGELVGQESRKSVVRKVAEAVGLVRDNEDNVTRDLNRLRKAVSDRQPSELAKLTQHHLGHPVSATAIRNFVEKRSVPSAGDLTALARVVLLQRWDSERGLVYDNEPPNFNAAAPDLNARKPERAIPATARPLVEMPRPSAAEAVAIVNVLQNIKADDTIPLRALRDGLSQQLGYDDDFSYRMERLAKLTAILFDNKVIFNAPDPKRPSVSLVRVEQGDGGYGLSWIRRFADGRA